jgi:multiple antibiotic resistance protein
MFGLTLDDFRIAGGLLMLLIALTMVHGSESTMHAPTDWERADLCAREPHSVAIYPLTVPLLVGPGTIAAMIVFGQDAIAANQELELANGVAAFLVSLAVALFAAPLFAHLLSIRVMAITQRLMGLILVAIAVQMILAGASFS